MSKLGETCPNCGHLYQLKDEGHFVGWPGCYTCTPRTRELSKWDLRFMELAKVVSTWSKDPSTKVGAVLVSPDRTDIILGYNGFARQLSDEPALYQDREVKYGRIIHAEINAIVLARRPVQGYTLYTWPFLTCGSCAPILIQAGITRFVAPKPSADIISRWEPSLVRTRRYCQEASVEVCEFTPETGSY